MPARCRTLRTVGTRPPRTAFPSPVSTLARSRRSSEAPECGAAALRAGYRYCSMARGLMRLTKSGAPRGVQPDSLRTEAHVFASSWSGFPHLDLRVRPDRLVQMTRTRGGRHKSNHLRRVDSRGWMAATGAWLLTDQGLGGRHWTRTSDLRHVKRFRLSAAIGAWAAEQNCVSYTVTANEPRDPTVGLALVAGLRSRCELQGRDADS
jgi:hypothetical protein